MIQPSKGLSLANSFAGIKLILHIILDAIAVGKATITSDKKKFVEYAWQSEGEKAMFVPEFKKGPLGL
jgi:hypothetical protein